jgi:hypothetical protein
MVFAETVPTMQWGGSLVQDFRSKKISPVVKKIGRGWLFSFKNRRTVFLGCSSEFAIQNVFQSWSKKRSWLREGFSSDWGHGLHCILLSRILLQDIVLCVGGWSGICIKCRIFFWQFANSQVKHWNCDCFPRKVAKKMITGGFRCQGFRARNHLKFLMGVNWFGFVSINGKKSSFGAKK